MKNKIKQLRERVLNCLSGNIDCRNNDKILIWSVWENEISFTLKRISKTAFINFVSNPASIIRIRAAIQNNTNETLENRCLPTDEKVAKQRKIAEEDWKESMRLFSQDNRYLF